MITTALQQQQDGMRSTTVNSQNKSRGLGIQAKLTVGRPNDKYEREADRIANQVMQMSDRTAVQRKCTDCEKEEKIQQKPLAAGITPWVQRQAEEEREKDMVQTKLLQRQPQEEEEAIQSKLMLQRKAIEEEDPLQTKRFAPENPVPGASLESRLNGSKSGGSPLPDNTRSFMENRIGTDFSKVKIHTDSNAIQMSRELGAQAFTHGNHIYFNSGKYSPESTSGKHLLAHEMVHTVQQKENHNKLIMKNSSLEQKKLIETRRMVRLPVKASLTFRGPGLGQGFKNILTETIVRLGDYLEREGLKKSIMKAYENNYNDIKHILYNQGLGVLLTIKLQSTKPMPSTNFKVAHSFLSMIVRSGQNVEEALSKAVLSRGPDPNLIYAGSYNIWYPPIPGIKRLAIVNSKGVYLCKKPRYWNKNDIKYRVVLKLGTRLRVIKEVKDWVKVSVVDGNYKGKEGWWLMRQYITYK